MAKKTNPFTQDFQSIAQSADDAVFEFLKQGNQKTKIDAGKSETEAMQAVEFKVGGSSIKIDQGGITIEAAIILIKGTSMVGIVGGASTKVKGGIVVSIESDGLAQVKAAAVKLN